MPDVKLIGENYTPPDLIAKVTGRARYAEDYRIDGMLFAKLLLSPMPHARVRRVDTRAAQRSPASKPFSVPPICPICAAPSARSRTSRFIRANPSWPSRPSTS